MHCTKLPEINTWTTLVNVCWTNRANTTLAEEYADESWVVLLGPVLIWKTEGVGVVIRRVAELDKPVHGQLEITTFYDLVFRRTTVNQVEGAILVHCTL